MLGRIRNSSTRVFDIRHDFVIAASALFLSFSPSKQRIVALDRYLFWERLDFRFFRRIPLSVHIVWLRFVSTHVNLTIHIFMNFHSSLAGLLVISCVFTFILAARYTTSRLLVKFLQNHNEVFFFTLIDRQNVNAQISQTAQSVNNFYSTQMTLDYLPRRFSSLLFNSVPK